MQNDLQVPFLRALQTLARPVLIDSLIRNEQKSLVLWVIVIFVTLRSELVSETSFCDLIGQSYQGLHGSGGDPYPAPGENEESLREAETH